MAALARWLRSTDFVVLPRRGWQSILVAAGAGLAFGLWMVAADSTVFAGVIPASQRVLFEQTPLALRVPVIAGLVLYDEIVLRAVAQTGLIGALLALTGQKRPGLFWTAIGLTAGVVWPLVTQRYLSGLDWSVLVVLRELALHVSAGVLWGWLCWRHGWLSGLVGHLSAYGALLPLLSS